MLRVPMHLRPKLRQDLNILHKMYDSNRIEIKKRLREKMKEQKSVLKLG